MTVRRAKQMATTGAQAPAKRKPDVAREAKKKIISHAFWTLFFESNCQKPNDELRLFPVNKTFPEIYNEYFLPWYKRLAKEGMYDDADPPKFGV